MSEVKPPHPVFMGGYIFVVSWIKTYEHGVEVFNSLEKAQVFIETYKDFDSVELYQARSIRLTVKRRKNGRADFTLLDPAKGKVKS